jgi:glycerol-1-phosphate dehydrogenase [NAD(P)+]
MLDMHQGAKSLPVGQHGAQVGVGSVYAASIWELIFLKFSKGDISFSKLPDEHLLREKVYTTFQFLDPSGSLADECWKDYEKKLDFWVSNISTIESVIKNLRSHIEELRTLIKSPEEIVSGLVSSGTPMAFADLEPVINSEVARWAVANCHLMRNRFVGIDLLEFLGMWSESEINWVIERASQAIKEMGVSK